MGKDEVIVFGGDEEGGDEGLLDVLEGIDVLDVEMVLS